MISFLSIKGKVMNRILLLISLVLISSFSFGQVLSVSGKIFNEDGKPIENAIITVKGSDVKSISNKNGFYRISAKEGDILYVTHVGSATSEVLVSIQSIIVIGDSNIIDITLTGEDTIFEMSLEELMHLQVETASKKSQSLSEAPASVIVITESMIKNRGYHHLEEILHDIPGFDFNKNYGVNYSTIFMRGYRSENSDRFLLLFDGISENDIWKQTTWISRQYPVSQIKQIEILYGPASALYGTNAFSGIINVITKKGGDVGDLNFTITEGSWGRKNIEFSTGKTMKNFSYNITGKYFSQNDLHQWDEHDAITGDPKNFSQSYLNSIGQNMTYWVDGELVQEDFNQNIPSEDYAIHANIKMGDLMFTAINWHKNEKEAYFYNPFKRSGPWTEWYENNQAYMISHKKNINDKVSFQSNVTFRYHKIKDSQETGFKYYSEALTDENDPDYEHSQTIVNSDPTTYQLKPRSVTLNNGTDTVVTGIVTHNRLGVWDIAMEEQVTYNITKWLNMIGGFRYTYTDTQEDYEFADYAYHFEMSPRHVKKTMAAYSQLIISPIKQLNLTVGGRFEDQKDERSVGYSIFVPRASLVYKASKNVIFRLQYAEAFQEADDWHKFATDFDIRPYNSANLEPEKLQSIEFGTTLNLFNKFLFSGNAYRTVVSNFIAKVLNTPENPYHGYEYGEHFENIDGGEVTIYGYEVNFRAPIISGLSLNGNVSGAYNYGPADKMTLGDDGNYVLVLDNEGNSITDNVLIGDMAPYKVNFGISYNYKNKFSLYPKVNYVSAKKTINWRADLNTPKFREIGGYAIVGLNINILNMFGFIKGLDLNVKFDNILDEEYYNPGSRSANGVKYTARVLQPGFNFMTGLSYSF